MVADGAGLATSVATLATISVAAINPAPNATLAPLRLRRSLTWSGGQGSLEATKP